MSGLAPTSRAAGPARRRAATRMDTRAGARARTAVAQARDPAVEGASCTAGTPYAGRNDSKDWEATT